MSIADRRPGVVTDELAVTFGVSPELLQSAVAQEIWDRIGGGYRIRDEEAVQVMRRQIEYIKCESIGGHAPSDPSADRSICLACETEVPRASYI